MFLRNLRPEELDIIRRVESLVRGGDRPEPDRDPTHVFEVVRLCVEIATRVGHQVHPMVLILTALFQDLGNRLAGRGPAAGYLGAVVAESFLRVTGLSEYERMQIVRAVAMADPAGTGVAETVEERIVADAQRLDRMGMVGLVGGLCVGWNKAETTLASIVATCETDYQSLYFDESRQIGEPLYHQTRILSESLDKALKLRPASIDQIVLPQ